MADKFMEPEEYEEYLKTEFVTGMTTDNEEATKAPESVVTLYELNQNIIAQMPALDEMGWEDARINFINWYKKNYAEYYMLLCKELSHYTIFHLQNIDEDIIDNFWEEIKDMAVNWISENCVHVMEEDDNGALAIWVTYPRTDTAHCFYLFPYDSGVVKV